MKIFKFTDLKDADLIIDAVYEGGSNGNAGDDPISKLLNVGNQGGFRVKGSFNNIQYLVLYTSGVDKDWPDYINLETGIFQYFGDNKKPGHELHDTPKKGNLILKNIFDELHKTASSERKIPPIFIFEKYITPNSKRSVQFKGLCVPGSENLKATDDLIAIWKTTNNQRFQNYKAYFTILNIPIINKTWINSLENGILNCADEPDNWKSWVEKGKYNALKSERTSTIRTVNDQIPNDKLKRFLLLEVFRHFKPNPYIFEYFAAEIFNMSDGNVIIDEVTRGVIDGGKDAHGRYKLGIKSDPIYVEFSLEAKCYNPGLNDGIINTVGVKETSRLISRIRNRQFGVLVTTSAISKQAYEEVRDDEHPIIFISGIDIINILISKGINTIEILSTWLRNNFEV